MSLEYLLIIKFFVVNIFLNLIVEFFFLFLTMIFYFFIFISLYIIYVFCVDIENIFGRVKGCLSLLGKGNGVLRYVFDNIIMYVNLRSLNFLIFFFRFIRVYYY